MSQSPGADVKAPSSRRRQLLTRLASIAVLGSMATIVTAAGCTPSDPRIESQTGVIPNGSAAGTRRVPSTSASSSSATPAVVLSAVTGEQALADLAEVILTGPYRAQLPGAQGRTLTAIRDAHREHAADLRSTQPTRRSAVPPALSQVPVPAGFAKLSLGSSLQMLGGAEQRQAGRLRRAGQGAVGLQALLWASLALAADGYADALGPRSSLPVARSQAQHAAMPTMTDIAAMQAMVAQLHALIYGYQVALGQLSESSPAGRQALADLAARRRVRDQLVKILLARSASVPAAAAAYVPSINPTTAARSAALISRMETRSEPFCGLWLASAAGNDDRRAALDALADTVATARSWGAPVGAWPGWVD